VNLTFYNFLIILLYPRSARVCVRHVGSMLRYIARYSLRSHYDDSSWRSNNLAPRLRRCLVNTRYSLMSILLSLTRDEITCGPLAVALTVISMLDHTARNDSCIVYLEFSLHSRFDLVVGKLQSRAANPIFVRLT